MIDLCAQVAAFVCCTTQVRQTITAGLEQEILHVTHGYSLPTEATDATNWPSSPESVQPRIYLTN